MKPVPNVTGIVKAAEANNNDVAKETVKPTPILTNPKATPEKSPLDGIGEFDKAFLKSRRAYEPKYLKTGLSTTPKTEVWDEGLEGFITHEGTKRRNPDHKFSSAKLWSGFKRIHAGQRRTPIYSRSLERKKVQAFCLLQIFLSGIRTTHCVTLALIRRF